MTFQELGETLQREREAKGLSIKAVMEATKISRVIILALESGDRSALPHPVYTKGFVKSYARLLGLDPDELAMVVDREYQLEQPEAGDLSYDVAPTAGKAFQDNESGKSRKRSVWPSILVVVALGCAAVILVLNLNKAKTPETPAPEAAPAGEAVAPAPETTAPEAVQPGVEEQAAPEGQPEASEVPASEDQAPAVAPAPAEPAPTKAPPEPAKPAQAAPAAPSARADAQDEEAAITQETEPADAQYDHVLIIRATTDKGCWIGVWRGEETQMARDFVLRKGEPLRLMFNSPRRIRIGNVAGVTVTYNGQPYPLDAAKGNIQTLTFGM